MKRLCVAQLFALMTLLPLAGAVAAQAGQPPQNVLSLAASGTVEVQQDWLAMTLSTTRDGSDAATVQNQLKVALDAALAEARKAAQPGQVEVRTGAFALHPRHGRDGRIAGWQGSAELVIEGRDVATIAATAARLAPLTVSQVGFSLSREARQRVEGEAQAQAIERFRSRAAELARQFGFSGYTLREVNVSSSDGIGLRRTPMLASAPVGAAASEMAVPVEAGKATVSVTVSGSIQMR